MDTARFAAVAIEGSKNYYDFLARQGRGQEEIRVDRIEREDALYLLHLSKNPFSTDAILIMIGAREYSQRELEPVEHDRDRHVLYVRVSGEIADPFIGRSAQDVLVISDLKFLIQRVCEWYAGNKSSLRFPAPAPRLRIDNWMQNDLSPGQRNAVNDVFAHSQSYIWGAPGTGKTRYVLAECLLQYYRAGKKIAVLAPTNNAIEQVLYGVLERLQQHDIPLDRVLRLGTPTTKFAGKYGDVCEVQGVEKQLNELQGQVSFLNKILQHRDFLKRLQHIEKNILPAFNSALNLLDVIRKQNADLRAINAHYEAAANHQRALQTEQLNAERLLCRQQEHMQSISCRISSRLSSTKAQEENQKLETLRQNTVKAKQQNKAASIKYEQTRKEAQEKADAIAQTDTAADKAITQLKLELAKIAQFKPLAGSLNRISVAACQSKVLEAVEAGRKKQLEGLERYAAYKGQTDAEIRTRISQLEDQKTILEAQSTQKRLQEAQVIAATVDTFLFRIQPRYFDDERVLDHIFLDEAGYSSLAKCMVLFGYSCPVAMLGDHMQLPPVCEASEKQLQEEENKNAFLYAQSALHIEAAMICENEEELLKYYLRHKQPSFNKLHRSTLYETYRFGSCLAQALEQYVYRNGFISAVNNKDFIIEVLNARRTPGYERRQNRGEAEVIKNRLELLATTDYAILTPYKNQVALLGVMLPEERRQQRIMTIHASQGREWDTVFLSVVDTSDMYFTNTRRPETGGLQIINTAVSRAKRRLIITCDKQFWLSQPGQLIRELVALSGYSDA